MKIFYLILDGQCKFLKVAVDMKGWIRKVNKCELSYHFYFTTLG